MKNLCVFLLALLLFACFDESSVTQAYREKEYDPDFGWRKGDFIPVLDESKSFGGLKSIYHVGDRIVLVDDYWSSNEYTSLESVTYTPKAVRLEDRIDSLGRTCHFRVDSLRVRGLHRPLCRDPA